MSDNLEYETRHQYWKTIDRLIKIAEESMPDAAHRIELYNIKREHEWDGLSCYCGGGWLVGHNAGCPEAAPPKPNLTK